jgi:anti-anti-sigma factor
MTRSSYGAVSPTYYPPCPDPVLTVTVDPTLGPERARVQVSGELDLAGAPALGQLLDTLCSKGCRWIEVDLTAVEFLAASGLHELARTAEVLANLDGRLTLTGLSPQQQLILDITGLAATLTGGIPREAARPSLAAG